MAVVRAIVDADVDPSASVNDTKLQHRYALEYEQSGTVVADTGKALTTIKGATGTIRSFQGLIWSAVATGGDRTVNVDLQKSTGGGAFSTILSATLLFNSSSTLLTAASGSFTSTAVQAGDVLKVIVTVAGAAGAQAIGLHVTLIVAETPS